MYVEQKIITISDGIIRSVGYSKIATNFNVEKFVLESKKFLQVNLIK